jgi:predicted negative regulator of RcsB-dependent stress response
MNFIGKERIGGADEFRSVQNAARILTRQQKFDKSLSTLRLIDTKNTQGTWRYTTLLLEAEILAAAGRKEKARESLRALLADEKLDKRTRETATKLLDVLP